MIGLLLQDFDLCIPCYKKESHRHEMTKLGLGLDDITSTGKEENPQESRRKSIQRCITSLVHACQCKNANCRINACHKMKRVVAHTLGCRRKTNNSCPICKQMIALCCYHAKHCTENKCPVPFCPQLKQKLRQKQLLTNLHQAQMLRRRVAIMTNNVNSGPAGAPAHESSPSASTSSPFSSLGKTAGPPRGAIMAAQDAQLQAEKQRQGAAVPTMNSVGKGKPALQAPLRPSPPTMGPLPGKPVASTPRPSWPPYPQVPPQQPRPAVSGNMRLQGIQLPHSQQQPSVPSIGPSSVSSIAVPAATSASSTSPIGNAVQDMLQAFKDRQIPQAEWLAVLRKNPQLMAQVLKFKNEKIVQQQQQQQQMHSVPNMSQPIAQAGGQIQQQMRGQMNQMMPQQYRQQQIQPQQQTSQINQFAQPQQPFVQRPRMSFQQTFQNDTGHNIHQFQQQQHMMQLKQQMAGGQPMSPQYMLSQQATPSPQQMLQQVRSPPATATGLPQTVRSPQPMPSPRQQPIPSPHHNLVSSQSPLHSLGMGQDTSQLTNDHVMLSSLQTHSSMSQMSNSDVTMGQPDSEVAPLTPQDQLAHFVSQI